MSEQKKLTKTVLSVVEELKSNKSTRFSRSDFQGLVYAVLSDPDFKAKKNFIKNDEIVTEEYCINDGLCQFLDKVLKHAGITTPDERKSIIDGFKYGVKDIDWLMDAVDEAQYQYSEAGKSMKMFRNQMRQLAIKKIQRKGKYEGKIGYKRTIDDLEAKVAKKKAQ